MSSRVHRRNLRITPTPSNLTKYAQKTLCTKTPPSRGVTGKTFPDTETNKKPRNTTQIPTGFGNPVKIVRFGNKSHCRDPIRLQGSPVISNSNKTDNTRGYFASCVVFFRAPQGHRIRDLLFHYKTGVILLQFYLIRVFWKSVQEARERCKQHKKLAKDLYMNR